MSSLYHSAWYPHFYQFCESNPPLHNQSRGLFYDKDGGENVPFGPFLDERVSNRSPSEGSFIRFDVNKMVLYVGR